jgi:beta-lactamase class D
MLLVSSWLLLAQLSRFESRGLTGTMVIENLAGTKRHVIKAERAKQPFAPASTFKIPHTRIALEEKAAAGPEETFRWDGTKRDFPLPHHDQTLASACKVSCVWCCRILASRLSQDICRWRLERLNYGRIRPQFALPHFWPNSELQISAEDQIRFSVASSITSFPTCQDQRK